MNIEQLFERVKNIKYEQFRKYCAILYNSLIDRHRGDDKTVNLLLDEYEECLEVFQSLDSSYQINLAISKYKKCSLHAQNNIKEVLNSVYEDYIKGDE